MTFRLAGSLPQNVVRQWKRERQWLAYLAETNATHYELVKRDFERVWFRKFELILDGSAFGPLWLRDERVASAVANSLHYRHGKVYRLDAFTIMPNHVHTVIKPLPLVGAEGVTYHSLAAIMQSLKGYTAYEANKLLGREGEFWAHESFDHWIRDFDEWRRVLNNPVKVGYVKRWQDWKLSHRRV